MIAGPTLFCGFTAIVCILTWSVAQTIISMKLKMLYVEPDEKS